MSWWQFWKKKKVIPKQLDKVIIQRGEGDWLRVILKDIEGNTLFDRARYLSDRGRLEIDFHEENN